MAGNIDDYIGTTIKRLRESYQYTQEELAEKSSLGLKAIRLLEADMQPAYLSTLSALARGFNMLASEFVAEIQKDFHKQKQSPEK